MAESPQKPGDAEATLAVIAFADRERARQNFALVRQRVPEGLTNLIPALLVDSPDPDAALNWLERWTEAAGSELVRLLDRHRSLLHYSLTVFGYSQFLSETLMQSPDVFQTLLREETLDRSHSHEEFREAFARFRSRSFETDIALLLARFKRREYIRIMLRDVLGFATLAETTAEISVVSDVLIEEALRECIVEMRRKYGEAQHRDRENRLVETPFAVLALGKLGGNELNYSSDIDLLYLYGDGEADDDAPITNREYFVRLGQQVTNVLSRVTPEGLVFRIDLRLRPQGCEGETAISSGHAQRYYSETAHDWERQAMIKARPVAGDLKLARQFIRKLQDHVYTEQVNFAAIETALKSLEKMRERRSSESAVDVKLDRGGIRDIEFLVQCLQRVYGGSERWLRSGGTLFSLQKLHDKRHISGSDFHHLTTAYEFLRCIEHRLQLRRGQQTHRIPEDEHGLEVLARSLGRSGTDPVHPQALLANVRERMAKVSQVYDRIIHEQQQRSEQQVAETFELQSAEIEFGRIPSDQQVLQRLSSDSAALYQIATRNDLEPHTRRNLFKFLSSSFTSSERYRAVAAAPEAVERALELFRTSEFLTDILVRHPEDIGSLNEMRASSARIQDGVLFPVEGPIYRGQSHGLQDYFASEAISYSERMAVLRRRFRYRTLLAGARDLIEARPLVASLRDMTSAAEEAIAAAWAMAGRPKGLAILALGRLGTCEFDCLSDADLLFVREKRMSTKAAARVAEDIVEALSAYTSEGSVMPVDVRLRPHGGEGEMVTTAENLAAYFRNEALAWEALTYTKVRWIAGNQGIATKAIAASRELRERFSAEQSFAADVIEMRQKLEKSEPSLKTLPGGSYDIDFITSYLMIKHGVHTAEGTTAERLKKLGRSGFLEKPDLQKLLDALELLRSVDHAIRLVTARPAKDLPVAETTHRSVTELTRRLLTRELVMPLPEELQSVRREVRERFDRLIR